MLQFVLGDVLKNHQQWCIQDICTTLSEKKSNNIFYIVPDHLKFDSEVEVLTGLQKFFQQNHTMYANLSVNIYSFTRLAWFLLKDSTILTKRQLSHTGLSIVVRYVLQQHAHQLTYYRYEWKKQGFIERLTELFLELRQGNVSVDHFEQFLKHNFPTHEYDKNRKEKLQELSLLYQSFNEQLIGQYVEKEDLYTALVDYILNTDFSHSVFYLHGFEYFNAKELQIVLALLQKAKKVVITLPFDKKQQKQLFNPITYIPYQTYKKISHFAKTLGIKQFIDITVSDGNERYNTSMQQLVTKWSNLFQNGDTNSVDVSNALFITPLPSKQEEVENVVRLITEMIATQQYDYKDFYVLMRQVEDYEVILKPLFEESNIPFFFDNASEMASHPLMELLSSLKDIKKYHWQYRDVMRLLKTYLFPILTMDSIDLLENELLAQGYYGSWWFNDDVWENQDTRQKIIYIVKPYVDALDNCQTMMDAATVLYQFIEKNGVLTTLKQWRNDYTTNGQLYKAKQQEQAWQTFKQLLDEFVVVLGAQPFDSDDFYTVLMEGFSQSEFNIVPPSLDQVTISSIDGKRVSPKKITFVIGATDTQFPKWYDNTTLLSNKERELLSQVMDDNSFFNIDVSYRTRVEPFIAVQLLASATEKLFLFYPENESSESTYMTLLKSHFNVGTVQQEQLFGKGKLFVRKVIQQLSNAYYNKNNIVESTKMALQLIEKDAQLSKHFNILKKSLVYKNTPERLTNARQLYVGDFHLSISQLENYFLDPYSHFLKYGLKLKERQLFDLTSAEIGTIYHTILDSVFKYIISDQKQLRDYTLEELERLNAQVMTNLFTNKAYATFERTQSMKFSKQQIEDTMQFTLKQLYEQSHLTNMNTVHTELWFSSQQTSDSLYVSPITLEYNRKLHIRGIIDKVESNENYYHVVDYKSSKRQFELYKFEAGISLQLLTYLYAVSTAFHNKQPLGAYYRHIAFEYDKVEMKQYNEPLSKKLIRMNGITTSPVSAFSQVDRSHQLFNVSITSKGEFDKRNTNIYTLEDMSILFDYLMLKIKEAGNRILSGDIALFPIKDEKFIPSLNEFQPIARFDTTLFENNYRLLQKDNVSIQTLKNKLTEKIKTNVDVKGGE